mgnify:CR=1 FL=1
MTAPRYQWQPTTKQIAERFGLRPADVIRFDHNTSPFPTSWASTEAPALAAGLNEYPAASYADLRQAASGYFGVDPTNVVPGAGVDEIILMIAKAFLPVNSRACAPVPTYPLYEIATLQTGAEFVAVPFDPPGFSFPNRALGEAAETSDVTWLCVPNNPTGLRYPDAEITAIVEAARGLVVIDAAYAEFAGDRWAHWIESFDNVIVTHTMSKAFGLAGARVGFALANPAIIDALDGVRPPGSISSISTHLAETALRTPQRVERHVGRLLRQRTWLEDALGNLGVGVVPDSRTNFLLCEFGSGAHALANALMAEGLVVRRFPADGPLSHFLRFTVRSREENDRLIDALRRHLP